MLFIHFVYILSHKKWEVFDYDIYDYDVSY